MLTSVFSPNSLHYCQTCISSLVILPAIAFFLSYRTFLRDEDRQLSTSAGPITRTPLLPSFPTNRIVTKPGISISVWHQSFQTCYQLNTFPCLPPPWPRISEHFGHTSLQEHHSSQFLHLSPIWEGADRLSKLRGSPALTARLWLVAHIKCNHHRKWVRTKPDRHGLCKAMNNSQWT